jgi:hypothetical protein
LPLRDRIVEEAQRFLDRRQRVPGMHLVEVDLLEAEAAERIVERLAEMPARQADIVGAVAHRKAPLGGDDRLAGFGRARLQPASDDLFRLAGAVDVGGIDEIAAPGEIVVEQLVRGGLVGLRAEGHGAEAIGGDDGPAGTELAIIHFFLLMRQSAPL